MEKKVRVGFALTGSFCTFADVIPVVRALVEAGYDVTPIMSEYSYATDTRFGRAADFANELEMLCDRKVIHTIADAEPVGPKKLFDILVVAPCTGNTLGKLNNGITDTSVTMAAKAHLRNQKPLLLAVSTNDALGNSAKNIGGLLNCKNIFFVPMKQDDPNGKPRSIVSEFSMIQQAIEQAIAGTQVQPVFL